MEERIRIHAILIADKVLKRVQTLAGIDASKAAAIIGSWAKEADDRWLYISSPFGTYDEFITDFAEKKLKSFAAERKKAMKPRKTAYNVTFEVTTRVVSDIDLTTTDDDSEVIASAIDKVVRRPGAYIIPENVTDVCLDADCPYDPQLDG